MTAYQSVDGLGSQRAVGVAQAFGDLEEPEGISGRLAEFAIDLSQAVSQVREPLLATPDAHRRVEVAEPQEIDLGARRIGRDEQRRLAFEAVRDLDLDEPFGIRLPELGLPRGRISRQDTPQEFQGVRNARPRSPVAVEEFDPEDFFGA